MANLISAAKEFKRSYATLYRSLKAKRFNIVNNPNSKLTDEMYSALEIEFAKDLAIRRTRRCLNSQGTYLDLGKCGLGDEDFDVDGELDTLIKQCTNLETLVLSNNFWNFDSRTWETSQNAQSNNRLTRIPSCIGTLKGLTKLICSGDPNDNWGISELDNVSILVDLETLNISYNIFKGVLHVSAFKKLRTLIASGNEITSVTSSKSLQVVDLLANKIAQTDFLQELPCLKVLQLSQNRFEKPPTFFDKSKIEELSISGNSIVSIESIKNLRLLSIVNLSENLIEDVSVLGEIKSLRWLDISKNLIKEIKLLEFVLKKNEAFEIFVNDNPFVHEFRLSIDANQNHFVILKESLHRAIAETKQVFYHPIKVMMLGNHSSGKTSIVNFLTNEKVNGGTHILQIRKHRFKKSNHHVPDVIFFDFGGQDFYHGIYQAFISGGGLQIISFKSSTEENKSGIDNEGVSIINYDRFFWLGQRRYAKKNPSINEPYFLIQTHADEDDGVELKSLSLHSIDGFRGGFNLSFSELKNFSDEELAVFESGKKYFEACFKNEIRRQRSPLSKEPKWYIDFINYILTRNDCTEKPLALTEILPFYNPLAVSDREKLILLRDRLDQLHRTGIVLYYKTHPVLRDFVWLDPQKLVEYVQQHILNRSRFTEHNGTIQKELLEKNLDDRIRILLELQKVIFLYKDYNSPQKDYYIIPNYLPLVDESNADYKLIVFGLTDPQFEIKFNDFIPFGLGNQMICFFGSFATLQKYWRNQLLFITNDGVRVLISVDYCKLKLGVYFQIGQDSAVNINAFTSYLFFSILALYWRFDATEIPAFLELPVEVIPSTSSDTVKNNFGLWNDLQIKKEYAPYDGFVSKDGRHYVKIEHLYGIQSESQKLPAYEIDPATFRILNIVSKYTPVNDYYNFTNSRLSRKRNVFISYSHDDYRHRLALQKYLVSLERDGLINIWQDGLIQAGDDWDAKIKDGLGNADICIMLVSQSFIISNYVNEIEMKKVLERRANDECRVIPFLIEECDWQNWSIYPSEVASRVKTEMNPGVNISSFQFLPNDQGRIKAANKWTFPEDAWLQLNDALRGFCKK